MSLPLSAYSALQIYEGGCFGHVGARNRMVDSRSSTGQRLLAALKPAVRSTGHPHTPPSSCSLCYGSATRARRALCCCQSATSPGVQGGSHLQTDEQPPPTVGSSGPDSIENISNSQSHF